MNCFNHENSKAIGICKHCYKALCKECVVDLGNGLACKEHENEVKELNKLVSKNIKIHSNMPKNTSFTNLFYLFLGVVFIIFGYNFDGKYFNLPFIMGIGFVVFSLVIFFRSKVLFKDE